MHAVVMLIIAPSVGVPTPGNTEVHIYRNSKASLVEHFAAMLPADLSPLSGW